MIDPNPTSPTLIEQVKNHDESSWRLFVLLYDPLIHHWVRRAGVIEQDVTDVVQDVLHGVTVSIQSYKPRPGLTGGFRGWLRGLTRHKILDYREVRQKFPNGVGGTTVLGFLHEIQADDNEPLTDQEIIEEDRIILDKVLMLVRDLVGEHTWQAFWRMAVESQSAAEIAVDLGMTEKAVRQAKYRTSNKLKSLLGEDIERLFQRSTETASRS